MSYAPEQGGKESTSSAPEDEVGCVNSLILSGFLGLEIGNKSVASRYL